MQEIGDLVAAFVLLLGGVAVALVAGVLAVLAGEAIGVHPGIPMLLATFGFFFVVVLGIQLSARHGGARA